MEFALEQNPHIRRHDTLWGMMLDVIIALAPVEAFALIVYQLYAVRNILFSVATWVLLEILYLLGKSLIESRKEPLSFTERLKKACGIFSKPATYLVPCVSGLIYGLLVPANFWPLNADGTVNFKFTGFASVNPFTDGYAYLVIIIGALVGFVVGKAIFGGTGRNILNPAAVGFVFDKLVFGSRYAVANTAISAFGWGDSIVTGGTFLKIDPFTASGYSKFDLWSLIIGHTPGLMGETCKIAILIGLVYLLVRRVADWRVPAAFFGTFIVFTFFSGLLMMAWEKDFNVGLYVLYELFSGGVLFGGVYMLADPVTMPITRPNRILYGMLAAVFVVFWRLFLPHVSTNYTHEGMMFSILMANAIVPFLDCPKWSSNAYNKKNIITLAVVPVALLAVLLLTILITKNVAAGADTTSSVSTSASGSGTALSTGGSALLR
jgi:electron transport complex protein RnfD